MTNQYFSNKKILSDKAINHIDYINKKYNKEIQYSIDSSMIITEKDCTKTRMYKSMTPKVKLLDLTSVDAILSSTTDDITILNFSSFKNPGGMFLKGSSAQEESLCHSSILFPILSSTKLSEFYAYNRYYCSCKSDNGETNINRHMYLNRMIYSPKVLFFDKNKNKFANVITCAAPNYTAGKREGISNEINYRFLYKRIGFIFKALHYINSIEMRDIDLSLPKHTKTLILGAYGCGVFGQDPTMVANIFIDYINRYYGSMFDAIIFAIPKKFKDDYNAFKIVIDKYESNK